MLHVRIRVEGTIPADWSGWFEGMALLPEPPDGTLLLGDLPDQAALYGLVAKVRDLGLKLVTVCSRESGVAAPGGGSPGKQEG
jgi:hypothetical protein